MAAAMGRLFGKKHFLFSEKCTDIFFLFLL